MILAVLLGLLVVVEAFRAVVDMGYFHKKALGTTPITRQTVRVNNEMRKPKNEELIDLDQIDDPAMMADAMDTYFAGGEN
jgi:hypothetical protein